MKEFFKQEPESQHVVEFREYLTREYGIADTASQDEHMEIFKKSVLDTAREHGILPPMEPTELLGQEPID